MATMLICFTLELLLIWHVSSIPQSNENHTHVRAKRADAAAWSMFLWDDPFNIPYYFHNKARFPKYAIHNVETAFRMWESGTCVRFHEMQGISGRPHIKITISKSGICRSSTGVKNRSPYATKLRLTESCAKGINSIVHELGHSLGLQHTHKRFDRDDHVKIFFENVPKAYHGEFNKDDERYFNTFGVPYSFDSIMHYGFFSGSRSRSLRSSCALDPLMEVKMKQSKGKGIGFYDYSIINKMYCKQTCFSEEALKGLQFNGNLSQTISGKRCQKWTSKSPHIHHYQSMGDHSFCRNPDKSDSGPWCYTIDKKVRFEKCFHSCGELRNKPKCEGYCHNGGYWPPVNGCRKCKCPPGYSGKFCQTIPENPYNFLKCGGKVTTSGSVIQSPRHPDPYPDNAFCIWWIQAPEGHYSYLINHEFQLEICSKSSSNYDFLEVRDGICKSASDGPRFCGSELNHNVRSTGRDLVIVFSSNDQKSSKGFRFITYFLPMPKE